MDDTSTRGELITMVKISSFCHRKPCYIFSGTTGKWQEIEEPAPAGLAFSGMAAMGNCVYQVGGRENLYTGDNIERNWKHSPGVMEYCTTRY